MEQSDLEIKSIKCELKKIICFIFLLLVMSFNSSFLVVKATGNSSTTTGSALSQEKINENMETAVQEWLKGYTGDTIRGNTKDENGKEVNIYATKLPPEWSSEDGNERVFYASNGEGIYEYKDDNGNRYQKRFYVGAAASDDKDALSQIDVGTYTEFTGTTGFIEKGTHSDLYSGYQPNDAFLVLSREDGDMEGNSGVIYAKFDNNTFLASDALEMNIKDAKKDSIWNILAGAGSWLAQKAIDKLGAIINKLLLGIADGLQNMIDMVMNNERTTIYSVIFGKLPQLSINFWKTSSVDMSDGNISDAGEVDLDIDTAPAAVLKPVVSYWYKILQKIAISIYVVMLLYIGVRILIADTGASANKAREMLTSWLVGVIILALFPVVMRYIVEINQALVSELDPGSDFGEDQETTQGGATGGMPNSTEPVNNGAEGAGRIYLNADNQQYMLDFGKNVEEIEGTSNVITLADNGKDAEVLLTIQNKVTEEIKGYIVKTEESKYYLVSSNNTTIGSDIEQGSSRINIDNLLMFEPQSNLEYLVIGKDTNTTSNVVIGDIGTPEPIETNDPMVKLRSMAEEYNNLALTIIYIIMLGQLVVLLGMYYKRVLVISFLIVIFPIVAALHIWQKSNRGGRALGTWAKEYTILVLTQSFHAVIYVVLIQGGYDAFMNKNNMNWLIFLISVLFLFQAERIIRAIFGMRSSANTIGELAAAGTAAWATAKAYGSMFKRDKKEGNSDEDDLDDANEKVNDAKTKQNINTTTAATVANAGMHDDKDRDGNASGNLQAQVDKPLDNLDAAKAFMTQQGLQGKTKKNVITKALSTAGKATVSGTARAAGITLGLTSGLASGSLQEGIKNAVIFNEITGAAAKGVNAIVGYAHGAFAGQVMKMKVRSGAMDDKLREIGFDLDGEFDPDPIISSRKAEIIREALAQQVSGTRRSGKKTGEYQFVKSVDKQLRRDRK